MVGKPVCLSLNSYSVETRIKRTDFFYYSERHWVTKVHKNLKFYKHALSPLIVIGENYIIHDLQELVYATQRPDIGLQGFVMLIDSTVQM